MAKFTVIRVSRGTDLPPSLMRLEVPLLNSVERGGGRHGGATDYLQSLTFPSSPTWACSTTAP